MINEATTSLQPFWMAKRRPTRPKTDIANTAAKTPPAAPPRNPRGHKPSLLVLGAAIAGVVLGGCEIFSHSKSAHPWKSASHTTQTALPTTKNTGVPIQQPQPPEPPDQQELAEVTAAIPSSLATIKNINVPGAKRRIYFVPMMHPVSPLFESASAEDNLTNLLVTQKIIQTHRTQIPNSKQIETTISQLTGITIKIEKFEEKEEKYIATSQRRVGEILLTLRNKLGITKVYLDGMTQEFAASLNQACFGILPRIREEQKEQAQEYPAIKAAQQRIKSKTNSAEDDQRVQAYKTNNQNLSRNIQNVIATIQRGGILGADKLMLEGRMALAGAEDPNILTPLIKTYQSNNMSISVPESLLSTKRELYILDHIPDTNAIVNMGAAHTFSTTVPEYDKGHPENQFNLSIIKHTGLNSMVREYTAMYNAAPIKPEYRLIKELNKELKAVPPNIAQQIITERRNADFDLKAKHLIRNLGELNLRTEHIKFR